MLCKLIILAALLALVVVGYVFYELLKVPPLPHIPDRYWGKGNPKPDDTNIYPFTINVSNAEIDDLKLRIRSTNTLTPPLEGVNYEYGFNSDYLKVILDFWANNYNWKTFENEFNKFPQYKTQISGLNIHFLRVKPKSVPKGTKVLPLLILHGWPGSVKEFQKIIPMLTTPQKDTDFVFEVIAPSLPGYGWSDSAVRPGLGAAQMGLLFKKLMHRLGFDEFYVQGGDWGSIIGVDMATLYPETVKGLHSNMCVAHTSLSFLKQLVGSLYPPLVVDPKYADRMYPMSKTYGFMLLESGYFHIQATKPDTVGVGLQDSPAGLAAYILEKFVTWTDHRSFKFINDPEPKISNKQILTDVLDDVSIYWFTKTITTGVRMYAETQNKTQTALGLLKIPTHVPTACISFPKEIAYQSKFILEEKYRNLIQMTHPAKGGHFAALEEPQVLADDVWSFVKLARKIEKEKLEEKLRKQKEEKSDL